MRSRVLLGLGSNLDDRLGFLRRAVRLLGADPGGSLAIQSISAIYESDALLPEGADPDWARPYLNLALLGTTELAPPELLRWVKSVEASLGRDKGPRWSPRRIDIDVLDIEGVRLATPELALPHREATSRPFVLLPAADVAPDWVFPIGTGGAASAGALAAPWRADPVAVPFQTRRTPLMLTELVGVLNVTDDSFSDGGLWLDPDRAVEQAVAFAAAGATVVDIGAESTRPGAEPIGDEVEWRRLEPVLGRLRAQWPAGTGPLLSVDTRDPGTVERAIGLGADWINDVTGFDDPAMVEAVAAFAGDLVVMHSVTVPPVPGATLPPDRDPIASLLEWGAAKLAALEVAGIDRSRVILDPGIGFGKTAAQTARILGGIGELRALGVRLLVGHSRKSFLKSWFGSGPNPRCLEPPDRAIETLALTQELAATGIDYIRIHDVASASRALEAAALVRNRVGWGP